ncbi:MAG: flagellin [Fibromonadaceae bacterium]|jgi:flagellin|nr:flagellin [Fibromonadaceae bacterium]
MIINNNVRAMVTQHALYSNNSAMSKSLEKLSTGLRINRAQDDAAGLAMSEQMRGQIRGLGKAKQNAQDGIAALQIAEGGLSEISNILQRQRELAVQGANDTLTSTERKYIADEINQLGKEINRIRDTTDYNTINMLASFGFGTGDGVINTAQIGTLHIGPNSVRGDERQTGVGNAIKVSYNVHISGFSINTTNMANVNQATFNNAIASLESQIKSISGVRAGIGVYINRLEFTINNIANLEFNTQDAESRIRDTNFALETTKFTRNQIMVQSATSMLAQANMLPQSVLGLLS